jgi:hypothetical protein
MFASTLDFSQHIADKHHAIVAQKRNTPVFALLVMENLFLVAGCLKNLI